MAEVKCLARDVVRGVIGKSLENMFVMSHPAPEGKENLLLDGNYVILSVFSFQIICDSMLI